ncbi:MAG: AAA family ATPase [Planctomycetia bacterium]|nr:AAA family ATPase [Planctomycetia bacterium]
MLPAFDCNRISSRIIVKNGRRQFLVTGNLDGYFFINSPLGICRGLENALLHYAEILGYDLIMSLDTTLKPRFARPEMERLYSQIVDRATADDTGIPWDANDSSFANNAQSKEEPVNKDDTDKTENAANQVKSAARTTALFDKILHRLIPSTTRSFIIFQYPENLLEYESSGSLSSDSLERIKTLRNWANPPGGFGHIDTCSLLLVKESRLEEFERISAHLTGNLHSWTSNVRIGPPDTHEIAAFLTRIQCRYNLAGHPELLARQLYNQLCTSGDRGDGLYNISQIIRRNMNINPQADSLDLLCQDSCDKRNEVLQAARNQLNEMIGLKEVRTQLDKLQTIAKLKFHDQRRGKVASAYSLHTIFLGNPGTGKTEVARILGRIYYGLGLCDTQAFIEISAQDIASPYNPGDAIANMKQKINEALGGVLFIDEAYAFADNDWLRQAFEVLMKIMEDRRDSLIVIIAGYKERLNDIYKINPGIESRFSRKVEFSDYTTEELMQMLHASLAKAQRALTPAAAEKARQYILEKNRLGKFANGRGVRNLSQEIIVNAGAQGQYDEINERAVPGIERKETIDMILDDLSSNFIGLDSVKQQIRIFARRIERNMKLGKATTGSNYNMQFVGPPGTGKTTIGRYMSRVFNALGLIEGTDILETSATKLKGSYLGQSKDKVLALFKQAREEGKVIFIDEAYALCPRDSAVDSYATEVTDTIVSEITSETNANVIVILAGYKDEMAFMMQNANQGLKSRIRYCIDFPDYTTDECLRILYRHLRNNGCHCDSSQEMEIEKHLITLIEDQRNQRTFANARTIIQIAEKIIDNLSLRDSGADTVILNDLNPGDAL